MEQSRQVRDPDRPAPRVFTREQLERELAVVEARAKQPYSERFTAELAKFEESQRKRVEGERRLGNE